MFCARTQSPIGRNYVLCYKRYGFKVEDELKSGLKSLCCNNEALMQMSATDYRHVSFALELIIHCVPKNVHLYIFQITFSKINRF